MLIVAPDFDRRIDLPGAGPCPRPVDIDRSKTGFSNLVSLRVYSFAAGVTIDGEAEGDEVFIVLMRGAADIAIDHAGSRVGIYSLRANAGTRAVYMPPHASYQLSAVADCDIAYARVEPNGSLPDVAEFTPAAGRLDVAGHATAMDLALVILAEGESLSLAREDNGTAERFVHVRSNDGGTATLSGQTLADWFSTALSDGENATLEAKNGTIDVLTVTATARSLEEV